MDVDQYPEQLLTQSHVEDLSEFLKVNITLTNQRLNSLKPEQQDPHVKLLVIDSVNYLLGLLSSCDRKRFISELGNE